MVLIGDKNGRTHCYYIDDNNHTIDDVQYSESEFNKIIKEISNC